MRLVVKLDGGANPSWPTNSSASPVGNLVASPHSGLSASPASDRPTYYYRETTTEVNVEGEEGEGEEVDDDSGVVDKQFYYYDGDENDEAEVGEHDEFEAEPHDADDGPILRQGPKEDADAPQHPHLLFGRDRTREKVRLRREMLAQRAAEAREKKNEHIRDIMDPEFNEEKIGVTVQGASIIIGPQEMRMLNANRQANATLANRAESINQMMRNRLGQYNSQRKAVNDDLLRISNTTNATRLPKQLPALTAEHDQRLRAKVANFFDSEPLPPPVKDQTTPNSSSNEPPLGEFLNHLHNQLALTKSTAQGKSSFDPSYISTTVGSGQDYSHLSASWHLPSWVMRQGYTLKQQMLIQKAQQQLTPILKHRHHQASNKAFQGHPLRKSPSTKRVSWNERVDAIAIPVQSNGDKPLRKPGRHRQRSLSPSSMAQLNRLRDPVGKRSPRPGSSEANILERLGHQQQTQQQPFIAQTTVQHQHLSRSHAPLGGEMPSPMNPAAARRLERVRLVAPSSNAAALGRTTPGSTLQHTHSPAMATATHVSSNGSMFAAFPASDEANQRSLRMKSGLRATQSRDDAATLRRWRSLEAVLQRRNANQQAAQTRQQRPNAVMPSMATMLPSNLAMKPGVASPAQATTSSDPSTNQAGSTGSNATSTPLMSGPVKFHPRQAPTAATAAASTNQRQSPAAGAGSYSQQPAGKSNMTMVKTAPNGNLVFSAPINTPLFSSSMTATNANSSNLKNNSDSPARVNLLRVAKVEPDSYHVQVGIRLPTNAMA